MLPNPPGQLMIKATPCLVIKQLSIRIKQSTQESEYIVTGLLKDDKIAEQPEVIQNNHSQTSLHGEATQSLTLNSC